MLDTTRIGWQNACAMKTVPALFRFPGTAASAMLALITPAGPSLAAVTTAPGPGYQEGYDPAKEQCEGIGLLPDTAWGEPVNGLRAALSGPDKVRFNGPAEFKLVLRNVSDAAVHVAVAEDTFVRVVSTAGGPDHGQHLDSYNDKVTRWILQPGQQTVVRAARLLCTAANDLTPLKGLGEMTPGRYALTLGLGAGRGQEVITPGGKRELIPPPPGEWSGWLQAAPAPFDLLAEKVPLEILPPPELPAGCPGLAPFTDYPPQLREGGAYAGHLEFERAGFYLLPHPQRNHFWLQDSHRYDRNVYWGPFTELQMEQAGLVKLLEARGRSLLADKNGKSAAVECIELLLRCEGPMAAAGLRLAAQYRPVRDGHILSPRVIRERRRTFIRAGLEKEMRAALDHLTKNDPPLPPAADFTVITAAELPGDLPATAWGPEDDGLRAAALMPEKWRDGEPVPVRLFIRNVSAAPSF